jgi:nitrate reductase NapE
LELIEDAELHDASPKLSIILVACILVSEAALSTAVQFRRAEADSRVLRHQHTLNPGCAAKCPQARALIQIKAQMPPVPRVHQGNGPDAVPIPKLLSERPNMSAPGDDTTGRLRRRRMEIFAFLFLTAVVMPALAVGTVGSYGLAVWIYQMFAGPPGPPPTPH